MTVTDIATRTYNHGWRLDPIVRSLLDTDFYKLLMLKMIREFEPLIAFASNPDRWSEALSRAIRSDPPGHEARRRSIAAQNSWESRTEVLNQWLDEFPVLKSKRLATSPHLQA